MTTIDFLFVLGAYLVGAIPFGLLLSKTKRIDIRQQGSKNIGATNVTRLLGKKLGFLTLFLDLAKGYLPMYLAGIVLPASPTQHLVIGACGGAAVVGHMFPVYLGFKGGKGVATGLGVFLYLAPVAVLISLAIFVFVVRLSGFVSLGSLVASASITLWLWLLGEPGWKLVLGAFVAALIWLRHRENIVRLVRGTEKSWRKGKGNKGESPEAAGTH